MIDPQDLLYTNNFINSEILNENEINNQIQNYDRFTEYEKSRKSEDTNNTLKFINNDDQEEDEINIKKTLNEPFPINHNKNHYPLLDPLIKDISKNTYTKMKEEIISINTISRNRLLYRLSSQFDIKIPKSFSNVSKIEIENINIPNFLKSVNLIKNNFCWQYLSNYYLYNDLSINIIPFPDNDDTRRRYYSYFLLPYSVYKIPQITFENDINFNPALELTYQINIIPGNYTLETLINEIIQKSASVLHGFDPVQSNITVQYQKKDFCEEPYNSISAMRNTPNLWFFESDTKNGSILSTNKIEDIGITSIQTFKTSFNKSIFPPSEGYTPEYYRDNDIYYGYSSLGANYILPTEYIYITVPFMRNVTDLWFDNSANAGNATYYPDPINDPYNNPFIPSAFPLIINSPFTLQDIDESIFKNVTMTPFFNLDLYTTPDYFPDPINGPYTESEMKSINYYKFSDLITIPYGSTQIQLIRFAFRFNSLTAKGVPFSNTVGYPEKSYYVPEENNTILLNEGVINYFKTNNYNVSFNIGDIKYTIGRSLCTRFIYGKANKLYTHYKRQNIYETKESILEYFDFSIANSTNATIYNIYNLGFAFVHSNLYGNLLKNGIDEILNIFTFNQFKSIQSNLVFDSNNYFIKNNNYIYIKISFNGIDLSSIQQNQLLIGFNDNEYHINQNYSISNYVQDIAIGETIDCFSNYIEILKKDNNGIYCKVLTSIIPGNASILDNNSSAQIIFHAYDKLLDDITDIRIELLDAELRLLNTVNDYNFDLKFYYSTDKLKETSINTRTNKIDLVGNNY